MGGKWDTKYKSHYIPPQIDPRPFAQRWRLYLWGTSSRTYLINPRSDGEKNQLRELGAKSDGSTGKWFVPARMERTRFMAWIPGERVHRPLSDASAEDIAAATGQEYPEDSVSRAGTQITTSARLTNWTEVWQEFVQHFEQREQTIPLLQVMLPRNKIDTYTYFNGTWCNSDEKFFALLVSMKFTDVTSNATLAGEFKNNLIRMLISDNELSAGLEFIPYAEFITSKNVLPDGVYPFRDCLYNLVTGERLEYVDARELTPRTYLTEDIKDSMIAPTDDEWEEWDTEAYRFVRNCFDAIFVDDDMRAEVWTRIGASIMMHSNRAFKQAVVLWGHGHNAKTGFFDMMNVGLGVWAEPLGKAGFIQPNRNADPTKADSQFGAGLALNSDGTIMAARSTARGSQVIIVYQYTGTAWGHLGSQILSGARDYSGVALSSDGLTLAFGADQEDYAEVYHYDGDTQLWGRLASQPRQWPPV